ncbi:MAG: NYN domain-containing protein [Bacillota bacterium]|nr:NYN domain-containing protein [Bacillota bacterium]
MGEGPVSCVIIDGYNLINRVPDLAQRATGPGGLQAARSYLLGWLRRYQAARHRRVVLVLDGPNAGRSDFGPVEVVYCRSADDGVTRLAGPGAMVVTSDTVVAVAARARGAEAISSEDFWAALTSGAAQSQRLRGAAGRGRHAPEFSRDGEDDQSPGANLGRKKGNPKPRSKAEKRRAQARAELLRKV